MEGSLTLVVRPLSSSKTPIIEWMAITINIKIPLINKGLCIIVHMMITLETVKKNKQYKILWMSKSRYRIHLQEISIIGNLLNLFQANDSLPQFQTKIDYRHQTFLKWITLNKNINDRMMIGLSGTSLLRTILAGIDRLRYQAMFEVNQIIRMQMMQRVELQQGITFILLEAIIITFPKHRLVMPQQRIEIFLEIATMNSLIIIRIMKVRQLETRNEIVVRLTILQSRLKVGNSSQNPICSNKLH